MTKPVAETVARWMLDEFERQSGWLAQQDAAAQIEAKFGDAFVRTNDNGNVAIDRGALAAFRRLSGDAVVWDSAEKAWRRRIASDPKGSRRSE